MSVPDPAKMEEVKYAAEVAAAASAVTEMHIGKLASSVAEAVTQSIRNDLSTLGTIDKYAGRLIENHTKASQEPGTTHNLVEWLQSIEERTASNFDDNGRLRAAEKFSIGTGQIAVNNAVLALKGANDWTKFKVELSKFLGGDITTSRRYRTSIYESKIKQGESIDDFHMRLTTISLRWRTTEEGVDSEAYNLHVDALLAAMPSVFKFRLEQTDLKDPQKVVDKAVRYLSAHPSAKLNYGSEAKTQHEVIELNNISGRRLSCYRCKGPHIYIECPRQLQKCGECFTKGHISEECHLRCDVCYGVGHLGRYCSRNRQRRAYSSDRSQGSSAGGGECPPLSMPETAAEMSPHAAPLAPTCVIPDRFRARQGTTGRAPGNSSGTKDNNGATTGVDRTTTIDMMKVIALMTQMTEIMEIESDFPQIAEVVIEAEGIMETILTRRIGEETYAINVVGGRSARWTPTQTTHGGRRIV